jgi:hypothetical protein
LGVARGPIEDKETMRSSKASRPLVDEVDGICDALGEMSRSAWLRRAIRRQVRESLLKEVNLISAPDIRRALER